MKYNKVFRILALAVIFSLLMIAIPAAPALAASITLSPTSGTAGTTVTVTGSAFDAYIGQTVYICFNYSSITSISVTTSTFTATFTVPSSTAAGTTYVTVQYATPTYDPTYQIAAASFTVVARAITISPISGYVGDTVTVSGSGFGASSTVTIYFDSTSVDTVTTTSSGTFSSETFTVPESYKGNHTVKGTDTGGSSPDVTFTVSLKITVTPASGAVGDTLTISGSGFAASSTITFYWDSNVEGSTVPANAKGSFTNSSFTVPPSSRGSHTIKALDYSGNYATAAFTVAHRITISPASGVSGTTITVNGTGFSASRTITIKYNAVAVTTNPTTITTDSYGSFTATFTVPAGLAGTYPVEASDGTYTASSNFTATIEVTTSPVTSQAAPGYVGMEITISGTGFNPGSQITITYATTPIEVATTNCDAMGAFSATFKVPKSMAGTHTITASDGTNSLQATFYMESTAPAAPKPLLPAADGKAKSTAEFKWEGVTDDSLPVTYDLQIATDKAFTESAIILKKEGLTDLQYTLTKEEKLKSTKKDAPYYWRLRVVDAASNASGWSSSRTFYVGFIFPEIKGWVLYGLIGAGTLLLFFLGFWAGRSGRRSDYY